MVDFLKRFRKIFFKYWIRPWAPFMLMVSPFVLADDNEISLEQSGNNFSLDIEQVGYNNKIGMLDSASYINNAPNLDIQIVQYNFTSNQNQIIFDEVSGSNNTFKLGQGVAWQSDGSYTYDGAEGGGHYIEIDLYGDIDTSNGILRVEGRDIIRDTCNYI